MTKNKIIVNGEDINVENTIINAETVVVEKSVPQVFDDMKKILDKMTDLFDKEDQVINSLLPHEVLISKTGECEKYKTEKIVRSLLNLGIPLIPTYEIAQITVKKLRTKLYSHSNLETYISTKDIRQMVSLSIQECNAAKYSVNEIESWCNKYARRYGHNNQQVEIYWKNSDKVVKANYDYISKDFLDDVIYDILHGAGINNELSVSQRRVMATEILDFINSCDLYRIEYELLKNMIIEIATQPPHPWIVYDEIRKDILEYDYKALKRNLTKIAVALDSVERLEIYQSSILEVLHHASALILGMHNYFFGCYDLTAFYQLKEIIKILLDSESWNDTITRSKASCLLSSISCAGIDIKKLVDLIDKIHSNLKEHKLESERFAHEVKTFGEVAIQIYELGNNRHIKEVLYMDWSLCTPEEVLSAIKPLLYSMFPYRKYNLSYVKNHFWINYSFINLPSFDPLNFKNNFFVFYVESSDIDINFLNLLSDSATKRCCNTILIVVEDNQIIENFNKRLNGYMEKDKLNEYYQVIYFTKENLRDLFNSRDKAKWLDEFFLEAFELPI